MKTYKVFLTRSREASSLLADALWEQYKQNEGCSSALVVLIMMTGFLYCITTVVIFTRWSSMRVKDQSMS